MKQIEDIHTVLLGLGTNLGDLTHNMLTAIDMIGQQVGTVVRQSSFHESEPWGFHSDNKFLNAVVMVETTLQPQELLTATQSIERTMGRTRKSTNGQYHDRIIDIDILLYDDLHINEPNLIIPHPLMYKRPFVMEPLAEILQDSGSDNTIPQHR